MIAAVYARKSTEQTGVSEEQRSVQRQIDHARVYAVGKGWVVDEAHVYADDGISGAEFAKRPGFLRLMNALKPRPPFDVLVMSEESRLGREAIETAYALKQLIQAGVRVFFYLEDRERTLETPTDKLMLSVTAFADELEREKARQRTYDAMHRKALSKQVTGGRVFGYDNVDVTEDDGTGRPRRVSVTRRINEAEAAVVRRIFDLCAVGYGLKRITALLNAQAELAPKSQRQRPKGWAPSSVRAILFRDLYRGTIVWNQTKKRDQWGRQKVQDRPATEWLRVDAPELRVVTEDQWQAAHARLSATRENYRMATRGPLLFKPPTGAATKHLLTGLSRCACCGGSMAVRSRKQGHHGERTFLYVCSTFHYRGPSICANTVKVPVDVADCAALEMLEQDILDPVIVDMAIDQVVRILSRPDDTSARRDALEAEASKLRRELGNLSEIAAAGGAEVATLLASMRQREARLAEVRRQIEQLRVARPCLSDELIRREARARVADWRAVAGRGGAAARGLLSTVLQDRLTFTPVTEAEGAGYRISAPVSLGAMFWDVLPSVHNGWRPQRDSLDCEAFCVSRLAMAGA